MRTAGAAPGPARPAKVQRVARLASFRDGDGRFRFRLFSAEGEELLLSVPFADPKAAGTSQKRLKQLGATAAVVQVRGANLVLEIDGEAVASTPDYPDEAAREQALTRLRLALDQLATQD
jgi:tryptophanyl-tRNA synthetase